MLIERREHFPRLSPFLSFASCPPLPALVPTALCPLALSPLPFPRSWCLPSLRPPPPFASLPPIHLTSPPSLPLFITTIIITDIKQQTNADPKLFAFRFVQCTTEPYTI